MEHHGENIVDAWQKAYEADKVSIFGGIVATTAKYQGSPRIYETDFLEIIMHQNFAGGTNILCTKKEFAPFRGQYAE